MDNAHGKSTQDEDNPEEVAQWIHITQDEDNQSK